MKKTQCLIGQASLRERIPDGEPGGLKLIVGDVAELGIQERDQPFRHDIGAIIEAA
jgi:hypothetical protein